MVQLIHCDSHRHSADARRPGWIDLTTMKTTTNSRQTSPHISYNHIHNITKKNHLHSSNEENSLNEHADLHGNFFGGSVVTVKSHYKLALYKIPLDGAFVCTSIYKLCLLHSHAQNSLIINIIIIINYCHHCDLQEIISFIKLIIMIFHFI